MKTGSGIFQIGAEIPWEPAGEGIRRQIMGYDGQVMLVKVHFDKGAVGAAHEHYNSQVSYVESGRFELTIGEEVRVIGPGDGYYVEPDVRHGCVCLEEGVLLDIFSPHRTDFISKQFSKKD